MKCVANFGSNRVIIYHITTQRKNHHRAKPGRSQLVYTYKRKSI